MSLILSFKGIPPILDLIKLVLAMTLVGYSVYFYNDIQDLADDLKNRETGNDNPSNRPLGLGIVSFRMMWGFSIFSAISGLAVALSINIVVFILQSTYLGLGILYSTEPFRLKRRFLGKSITIGVGSLLATLSGSLTIGILNIQVIYFSLLNALLAAFLSPIADLRDLKGDKLSRMKTIPVMWGPEMTIRLALVSLAVVELATLIGYSQMKFSIALPLLFTLIIASLAYVVYPLINRWDDPRYINHVMFKRAFPLYLLLQFAPLIGIIKL